MILLDTDVLIDVALNRGPYADPAAELIDRVQSGPIRAFVAWHSLSNFYYLVRPARGDADARSFLRELTSFVLVAPTRTEDFQYATTLEMGDFEDAMQVAAARSCGAQILVTRNGKDYRTAPLDVRSPAEALEDLF